MFPKFRFVVLILSLSFPSIVTAQTAPEKNATEQADKLRKDAVAFLRETLADVNGMRSLENRISFTAELAGLMWFHDEREARAMYTGVITDFRDLLVRYDSQMNAFGIPPDGQDITAVYTPFGVEPSDRSRLLRKFSSAVGVRQTIAVSMAQHDPDLALTFYYDSLLAVSNPEFVKHYASRDSFFEYRLLSQIADKDPGKAAKYGARSLERGVNHQHLELLKKIYEKDADKGADFAAAMLSRFKSESRGKIEAYTLSSLIGFGGETLEGSRKPDGKRPIYTLSELRELAEVLAQSILNSNEEDGPEGLGYVGTVQKYLPGRAAQIRAKFKSSGSYGDDTDFVISSGSSRANMAANASITSGSRSANSNSNIGGSDYDPEDDAAARAEAKLLEEVQSLGTKELPKAERDRIVTQARQLLMENSSRAAKIAGLSMLAAQVAKMGDKELAGEIMRDAEKLVNPAPKNYNDFMLTWLLASGYAAADPDKAFPLLEETIGRANDTLAAFVKVGEFIDVAEEIIVDGEVQVGAFGGQMVQSLTRELGIADMTIEVLAKADFAKTKALTNRFDRIEVRTLAKMMVLRAVLDPKQAPLPDGTSEVTDGK
jgi:hypothetical protein